MKMILNVSDPHGAVLYPVYAYVEFNKEYIESLKRMKEMFKSVVKKHMNLQLMSFSDHTPDFWAGDLPKPTEIDLSECETVRDDSFHPDRLFKEAEQVSVDSCQLKLNEDRFYWSAVVKHTTERIWTAAIDFWEL